VVSEPEGFALNQEGQAGVHGPEPRALVLAEQPFLLLEIRG